MDAKLNDLFNPIGVGEWPDADLWNEDTLGHQITKYKEQDVFPELKGANLALFSLAEFRGSGSQTNKMSQSFRSSFYKLFEGEWNLNIIDLGHLKCGETLQDTYVVLSYVVEKLFSENVIPIVLSGTQDLDLGIYNAFSSRFQSINYLSIDARFDLGISSNRGPWKSYLNDIVNSDPNFLLNYIHLGFQGYLCHPAEVSLLEKLKFESLRLGALKSNIESAEPYIRDANFCSLDMSSVKQSDAPGAIDASPNGFDAHEICGLIRYAGMSDHVKVLNVSGWCSEKDNNQQTSHLVAQIVWHFIEGVSLRIEDEPTSSDMAYLKYIVTHKEMDIDFTFYKSRRSSRWWVELPNFKQNLKRIVIPCSYQEYLSALNQELPERWFRYYNRF